MYNFKYKHLVRVTMLCTELFLNREALAEKPLDLEGPNHVGPKNFYIPRPKYDWEDKKPQGSMRQGKTNLGDYRETRDRIAAKYGLTPRTVSSRAQGPALVESAEKFGRLCEELSNEEEKQNEEFRAFGRKVIEGGSAVADVVIDNRVKNENAKTIVTQLKNEVTSFLKEIFN